MNFYNEKGNETSSSTEIHSIEPGKRPSILTKNTTSRILEDWTLTTLIDVSFPMNDGQCYPNRSSSTNTTNSSKVNKNHWLEKIDENVFSNSD